MKTKYVYVVTSRNCITNETSISGVYDDIETAKKEASQVSLDTNRFNEEFEGSVESSTYHYTE